MFLVLNYHILFLSQWSTTTIIDILVSLQPAWSASTKQVSWTFFPSGSVISGGNALFASGKKSVQSQIWNLDSSISGSESSNTILNRFIDLLGRPEEPRVPQDLKKNDMVYLIALFRTKGKTFTASAIGVILPKSFCALLRKIIQEIDLTTNSGKATFVDMSMSYTGSPLHTEYSKVLFKQHQYMLDHLVERLSGLSCNGMTNVPLLKIPGVHSLHTMDRKVTSGSWRVVTTNDPLVATRIDNYIQKHYLTVLYDFPPNRSRKPSESVTKATKKAWISQTKDFTATSPPPEEFLVSNPQDYSTKTRSKIWQLLCEHTQHHQFPPRQHWWNYTPSLNSPGIQTWDQENAWSLRSLASNTDKTPGRHCAPQKPHPCTNFPQRFCLEEIPN